MRERSRCEFRPREPYSRSWSRATEYKRLPHAPWNLFDAADSGALRQGCLQRADLGVIGCDEQEIAQFERLYFTVFVSKRSIK